ncbi:hypothetical protein XCR1_860018 [Xenorhabdus cabanillasii JM26]|uniref:Uncharacterized protein n=1 Tax=Xenorhabdus cabanillasii JM26 TaxID=1427517 RepID=W1J930_9GAMM|nr:putative amino-acid transport protein [Xenorhabdus cabanillasii JM26]CDL87234.1 hypothetical protein XCR1_860018 [Xenorhabdus cabanillasii JM26]
MLIGLLGIGIFMQIRLFFLPIRKLGTGFKLIFQKNTRHSEGQISPFNALMTALSATIGTGNIAGIATAIVMGGPGALFWMWMTALVGMATKYSEAVLAVRYRETDKNGNYVGGPMYYIKNGLGKNGYGLEHYLLSSEVSPALALVIRYKPTQFLKYCKVALVLIKP